MNAQRFEIRPMVRMAALVAAALPLLYASSTFAAVRCDAPADHVDRAACAKAKESPEALRRYVARTQALYQLYFWDYMTPADIDGYHARQAALAAPQQVASK